MKHLLSIHDLTPAQVADLVDLAIDVKADPKKYAQTLAGKTLGMIFEKSSTRTRVSFEVGAYQLGGMALFLSSRDIQIGRGEPISDTAKVLSGYLDGIMARTFGHNIVEELAAHGSIPIINGLTDKLHPCQALADLVTIKERFGSLKGLRFTYVGDGNNMAHSLMLACAKAGMDFTCAAPEGYRMDRAVVAQGQLDADAAGTKLIETRNPRAAVDGAHIVYSDVWASMGQEDEQEQRVKDFDGFIVDDALMAGADRDAVFMHCLPAHRGEEVSASVCDGDQSIIFRQAHNRLHLQKAVMIRLMGA